MSKIGLRAHDIGTFEPEELADAIAKVGFDGVQLVFKKALKSMPDFHDLMSIKNAFSEKPKIFMLGAYFNPIHPNHDEVIKGIEYFKKHLEVANTLDASFVGSETGSLMGSPWGYLPENHTQESLDHVIDIFKDLTLYAEKHDTYVAVEGAWQHVAYSPKRIKEMVNKINNRHLKVTVDLYNFLNIDNYEQRMDILDESLELLKDDIVIFHLKDFIVENDKLKQVGLGKGLMDYPEILKRMLKAVPNAYLIFEGVTGDDIIPSYHYIKNILKKMED